MNNLKKIAAILSAAVVMMTAAVSCGSSSSSSSSEATTASTEASSEAETEEETEAETEEAPAADDIAAVLNETIWVGEEAGVPCAVAFEGNKMIGLTIAEGQVVQQMCEWTADADTMTVVLPDGTTSVDKFVLADDLSAFATTDEEGTTVQYERFTGDIEAIGAELALRAAESAAAPEEEIAE